jgi:guanylate kinase
MILLTGASASGKTETAKALMALFGLGKVVTHTTRPMRQGERDGIDYHFVTKQEFLKLKSMDFFVETTEYNGNYYGTSKPEIGDNKVLIVETSGARVFLSLNDPRIVAFRLIASQEMRALRMRQRGDSEESIQARLKNDVTRFADEQFHDERLIDINTEQLSIDKVASLVYRSYRTRLSELGEANGPKLR